MISGTLACPFGRTSAANLLPSLLRPSDQAKVKELPEVKKDLGQQCEHSKNCVKAFVLSLIAKRLNTI
jgi:hypothetical protein